MNFIYESLLNVLSKSYFLKASTVSITGIDAKQFLQGQLTANLDELNETHSFILGCRLNRTSQFQASLLIEEDLNCEKNTFHLYLIEQDKFDSNHSSKEHLKKIVEDLSRFLIMEEAEFLDVQDCFIEFSLSSKESNANLFNLPAKIKVIKEKPNDVSLSSKQDLDLLDFYLGNQLFSQVYDQKLVNETPFEKTAMSYSKGCFLGQETAGKIHARKGSAYFPYFMQAKINDQTSKLYLNGKKVLTLLNSSPVDKDLYLVHALRDVRVDFKDQQLFDTDQSPVEVHLFELPLLKDDAHKKLSDQFFKIGSNEFSKDNVKKAKNYLLKAIELNPLHEDALESYGVILGREENYKDAIAIMDQLKKVNPNCVMAYTNTSLFYMKLGKINEAEEEKAKATVLSFKVNSKMANDEKAKAEAQRLSELENRANMFRQVLAIDEDDQLANTGLAEYFFELKNYTKALKHIDVALKTNPNHSVSYLLKAKILKEDQSLLNVKEDGDFESFLSKGIEIATKNGDMMPANSMQALLNEELSSFDV